MTKSAEREQQSQKTRNIKIKVSLDGGDQSKMWSEDTNTLKHFRDIGKETQLPMKCGIGTWLFYSNISGKSGSQ